VETLACINGEILSAAGKLMDADKELVFIGGLKANTPYAKFKQQFMELNGITLMISDGQAAKFSSTRLKKHYTLLHRLLAGFLLSPDWYAVIITTTTSGCWA